MGTLLDQVNRGMLKGTVSKRGRKNGGIIRLIWWRQTPFYCRGPEYQLAYDITGNPASPQQQHRSRTLACKGQCKQSIRRYTLDVALLLQRKTVFWISFCYNSTLLYRNITRIKFVFFCNYAVKVRTLCHSDFNSRSFSLSRDILLVNKFIIY